MAPVISVVMPVYNGERFVGEAVESILAQTYGDFELLIVDDGSTDRTAEILSAFAERDPRVIVQTHATNAGFRDALNDGCRAARGTFVARMDADDVSLPHRFAAQIQALAQDPRIGVIGSCVQLIDERGKPARIRPVPIQPALVAWSMLFFNSLVHPAVMMRRDVLEAAGYYPSGCAGGTE